MPSETGVEDVHGVPRMKRTVLLIVVCMLVATALPTVAWGPNDPTDRLADPDGDRLGNLDEFRAGTNPLNPDTDMGGCWDGWEAFYGLDPTNGADDLYDSDNDGWTNLREFREGTNPINKNTDGDNYPLDSTDPHPLIPDGVGPREGPGVGPGPAPGPNPQPPGPCPGPPGPMPVPMPPLPGPWNPAPNPPPGPDPDTDHDGLEEFIEAM
jgi:hypothetical protein